MTAETSRWIPRRRIRIAFVVAAVLFAAAVAGALVSQLALLLLLPALMAAATGLVMLRVRYQLSPRGGGFEQRIHSLVVDRLPDAPLRVLDVGCGDASLIMALLERAPQLAATGVDLWANAWDYAQAACEERVTRRGWHVTFRRADAARLDFADGSFDFVSAVMCFHEVRAPAGESTRGPLLAIREALRVLRPGGHFVFIDRFRDASDFGDSAALSENLAAAASVRRAALVPTLRVPWPLSSHRALGPVDVISGQKQA